MMVEKFYPECMKPSGKNPAPNTPLDPNNDLTTKMETGPKDKEKDAVILIYCKTAMQVADIFTKQLFPKHFERLRMVLLGHENWDDMVQRVESVTTAGDDIDDPKLYASGDSAPRGQGGHPK